MADGSFPVLVSKDRSANAADNPLWAQLTDGTAALSVTSGALDVNVDNTVTVTGTVSVNEPVSVDDNGSSLTVDASDLDIRNIVNTQDNILVYGWDGTVNQKVKTDAAGELQVDILTMPSVTVANAYVDDSAYSVASGYVGVMGALADESSPDSVDEGDIGAPRMTLDRKLLTRVVGNTDTNRLDIDSSGHAQVDIAAISITALPVSATASVNSAANPIYVQNVTTGISATEVHDYATATPGADATANNDYTVTGTTFLLKSVIFSASGGMKAEVQAGPVASLVTKAVGFIPRQGGVEQLTFDPPIEVPVTSTGTVRVIMTNRQGASMDVYSTIIGNDIP